MLVAAPGTRTSRVVSTYQEPREAVESGDRLPQDSPDALRRWTGGGAKQGPDYRDATRCGAAPRRVPDVEQSQAGDGHWGFLISCYRRSGGGSCCWSGDGYGAVVERVQVGTFTALLNRRHPTFLTATVPAGDA